MCNALNRWSSFVPLSQRISAEHPSQGLFVAFFLSVLVHVFLALLLWNVTTNRRTVEPKFSSISTPLIVTLASLPATANNGLNRKSEAEVIVKSKDSEVPNSIIFKGNPPATDTTSTINLDALNRMEWNFGNIPEFKTEAVDEIINQGVQSSGTSVDNSLSSYLTPSYGLDAVNRFKQVFGEMAESELQRKKIEWRVDYIKKYEASLPPDCSLYYGSGGLLAIPIIFKDVITHNNKVCMW
jgi:hypothetical protein